LRLKRYLALSLRMRFLSTPLAALSASFITWYCLEQKVPLFQKEPADFADSTDVSTLQQALKDSTYRISELEASIAQLQMPEGSRDEIKVFLESGQRLLGILQDASGHALQAWGLNATWSTEKNLQIEKLTSQASDLWAILMMRARAASAEVQKKIPKELLEKAETSVEILKDKLFLVSTRSKAAGEAAVESFLQQHPRHHQSLAGLSEVNISHCVVLTLLLLAFLIQIVDILRLFVFLPMRLLRGFCCCCCRGARQQGKQ